MNYSSTDSLAAKGDNIWKWLARQAGIESVARSKRHPLTKKTTPKIPAFLAFCKCDLSKLRA